MPETRIQNKLMLFEDYGCYSVGKLCLTLCDSMDRSMQGSSLLHYVPEFAQIHYHWIGDAI